MGFKVGGKLVRKEEWRREVMRRIRKIYFLFLGLRGKGVWGIMVVIGDDERKSNIFKEEIVFS